MSIQEIIKSGANVTVSINIEDLRILLNEAILNAKKELEEFVRNDKEETYKTINQVSEILSVDKSTLYRWHKSKYLVRIETGGGRRYKMSEVKAVLSGGHV